MRAPTPPPDQRNKRARGLGRIAAGIGAVVMLLAAFVLFLLLTESGARLAWNAMQRIVPGQLSGEVVNGTLRDGLHLRNVGYEDQTKRLRIDRLEGKWQLTRAPLKLTVQNLRIGQVDLTLQPGPQEQPATLPQEIKLPLAIDLQRASVQELTVHSDGSTKRVTDIVLRASSDGVQHRVALERAETPFGKAASTLQLNGEAPFPLSGKGSLDGSSGGLAYQLESEVSGTLREPAVRLTGNAAGATVRADVAATPFGAVPLQRADVRVQNLNPKVLNDTWPEAGLDITADLSPVAGPADAGAALTVRGPVTVRNAAPGAIDSGRLPFTSAQADVVMDASRQQLAQLNVSLVGDATISGSGELRGSGQGKLDLQAINLDLHALHSALRKTDLDGPLTVTLAGDTQHLRLDLSDPEFSVMGDATLAPDQIRLETAQVQARDARLAVSGTMARGGESTFDAQGTLKAFNPALLFTPPKGKSGWNPAQAHINMDFQVRGQLQPALRADLRFDIGERSTYAGRPLTGGGHVALAGKQLLPSDARLSIAGNRAVLKGSFGAPGDALDVTIDAPALARLGFGLAGTLQVEGRLEGTLARPVIDGNYRAANLRFGEWRAARLAGEAQINGVPGTTPDAKVRLSIDGNGLQGAGSRLASVRAEVDGTYDRHTILLTAKGDVRGQPLDARLSAEGRLRAGGDGMRWDGTLGALDNAGFPRLALAGPLEVAVGPGSVDLGQGSLTLEGTSLELKGFHYDDTQLRSSGSFRALDVARLMTLRRQMTGEAAPFRTDLVLDGEWDIALADRARGFAAIKRRSGDVRLPQDQGGSRLGLTELSARADLQGIQAALSGVVAASRIGTMTADGIVALQRVDGRLAVAADSAISGRIAGGIPNLQSLGALLGPSIVLEGSTAVNLTVAGTVADPRVSGTAAGNNLAITLYDQGVRLRDGEARLVLDDNVVELQQLEFHSGGGTLRATGRLPLAQTRENMRAIIIADKLQLLANPSGRLTLSGRAEAGNADGRLRVTGNFVVDQALFSLPEKSPPRLDDDVVVIRGDDGDAKTPGGSGRVATNGQPPGPFSPQIDLQVDLGNDFRFEGSGAELRLVGTLNIRGAPGEAPQAFGTVRVSEGTVEAFGAELDIERGVINFQGPFQNPNLNILAMRRDQEVAAGVSVTGTVQRPRVQLVSEPNVPEEEKLSWLVFGRGGAGGGTEAGQAQAAARGAALGLLNKFGAERVAKGIGLDAFSFGESEFGLDGQQVVNLGKEISDRLTLGYEQSLASAEAVLKLTYELTRNWSVVLRGGAVTGLDLYFSKRFDRIGSASGETTLEP